MGTETAIEGYQPGYRLTDDGTFVIENYNHARPFASFFPGIAGLKGIPMWAFYVNRNQGITSFGVKNKNSALMEFSPANTAYGQAASTGFRTFLKTKRNGVTVVYEPFTYRSAARAIKQNMYIRPEEVVFEELNRTYDLKISVRYFTLPQESISALARVVTVTNTGRRTFEGEMLDGLPKVLPDSMNEYALKFMSYTAQAWVEVTNFEKNGLPFYKLKVEINDRPEVTVLEKGNFYFGLAGKGGRRPAKTPVIVDPELVFGQDLSFRYPHGFSSAGAFSVPRSQMGNNKYPAAMSYVPLKLKAGESVTLYSMAGHAGSEDELNRFFRRASSAGYFEKKAAENKALIADITGAVATKSSSHAFDLYCRQTYLDNLLRGGMPLMLPANGRKLVFYVYSRKHGDLERDYNNFQLSPTYYSQGNGNFRDMNQNKRNDVFFNPEIGDFNILAFYDLVQLDGYNPLLVKGASFSLDLETKPVQKLLKQLVYEKDLPALRGFLAKPFEPGALLLGIEQRGIRLKRSEEEFLRHILGLARHRQEAEHGEGFWTDHWTYNLDLLESYLALYPEKEREILLDKKEFTFFDNAHVVMPREEKYVDAEGKIRQFDAVVIDTNKAKMLRERTKDVHLVHDKNGQGNIYYTTLLVKMMCLVLNKLSTLDSDGIGVEMEADKPGWYDALNGLPGVFGSSVPETFELKRMIRFLQECLSALGLEPGYAIYLPEEMYRFFEGLERLLGTSPSLPAFEFWDRASALKEKYRKEVLFGVTGRETAITWNRLADFFAKAVEKIDAGLRKAVDPKTGLYYTYFSYEAVSWKRNGRVSHKGWPCVTVTKFKRRPLPLFLEGEVRYLKTEKDPRKVKALHQCVKKSALYDRALGMYKVNAPLKGESHDIGRCTVFSSGWLENESVWLHMEYKYILELLKAGLYPDFFEEFRKAGVCFRDPAVYGRSILENSSFIVSSAFPEKKTWGRGFVARLSGSTAEFIEMWLLMTCGKRPFVLNSSGELALELKPALPGGYFAADGTFSFTFLGTTSVKYHNPKKIDTFSSAAAIRRIHIRWQDGNESTIKGSAVTGNLARRIRNREAERIDVFFE